MALNGAASEKLKVFLSYSRADMAVADDLVTSLEAAGFTVFIDRRDLPYGEKWQQVLYEYIRDSDTVVFLVSGYAVSSQWVRWELQQVTDLKKRLVPVVISPIPPEILPPAIASVELLPKDGIFTIDSHLTSLVQTLNTNRAWVMEATKLQSRTFDWIGNAQTPALLLRGAALHSAEQWRQRKPESETLPGDLLDFLLSSRLQSNRRQRYWVIGSVAVAILASGLAATAYLKNMEAVRQKAEALHQKSEAEREQAEAVRQSNAATAQSAALTSLASDNDPVRGLLLAREALRQSEGTPSVTTVAAYRNAVLRFGPVPLLDGARRGLPIDEVEDAYALFREDETIKSLDVSDDGRWLLVEAQPKGTREIWLLDLEHPEPARTLRVIDSGLVDSITSYSSVNHPSPCGVSRGGRFLAASAGWSSKLGDGLYLFEREPGGTYRFRLANFAGEKGSGFCRFSDDEQYLTDGKHLWRLNDAGAIIQPKPLPAPKDATSPFFSIDSKRVGVAVFEDHGVRVATWPVPPTTGGQVEPFRSLRAAITAYPRLRPRPDVRGEKEHDLVSPDGRWEISWEEVYTNHWTASLPVVREYDKAGNLKAARKLPLAERPGDPGTASAPTACGNLEGVPVCRAAFNADGRRLVTIGQSLLVWDLTAPDPFARPFLDLATPGSQVAIDDSGSWVASFGRKLQIWDLRLEVPSAFPIETKSILDTIPSINPDDYKLRFAGKGAWLVVIGNYVIREFAEFWDLRFDNTDRAGKIARRNLTPQEWHSFFGNVAYHKTFGDQPASAEPLLAADTLARAGKVTEAVDAYRRIATAEPAIALDPGPRASRLAAQAVWEKGEDEALANRYESAVKLLKQAKGMNPSIPWDPEARAGQLTARQAEATLEKLAGYGDRDRDVNIDPGALIASLRSIQSRYPRLQFNDPNRYFNAPAGTPLDRAALLALVINVRNKAKSGGLRDALQFRSVLLQQSAKDVPSIEELQKSALEPMRISFGRLLRDYKFEDARAVADQIAAFDKPLGARMGPALDLVENFQLLEKTPAGNPEKAAGQTGSFQNLARDLLSNGDSAAELDLIDPSILNKICWRATTRHGLAGLVLPICEAAVRRNNNWQFRDSRGVAYAALNRFDAAIEDFNQALKGLSGAPKDMRLQWIQLLTGCQSAPATCRNPFTDPAFLRTIQ